MGTAIGLVDWALTQIGTTENPPGSNRVRYWDDIGMHGLQGQPWCCAFVLAGLKATGTTPVTKSVYVPTVRANYQATGRLHPIGEAQPGDQVLYHGHRFPQGHTGIVVSVDHLTRTLTAVEGNTASGTTGSQSNGGGVFLRQRSRQDTWGVGRPTFNAPHPPVVVTPFPGERMHRVDINVEHLDADGNGWAAVPNTAADRIVSIVAQGSYPPVDGYFNLPAFGRQQRGPDTIIQISEADPRAPSLVSVWVADQ